MAGRVVGRIFERIVGSATKKAVLLCLGEHANPDGEMSFPSVDRICQETELGESTVREALSWLRSQGLIVQTHAPAGHRPATYRVDLDRVSDLQLVEVYRKPDLQLVGPGVQGLEPDLQELEPDLQVVESRGPGAGPEPPLTVIKNRPIEPSGNGGPPAASRSQTQWVEILARLRKELPKPTFETWVRGTEVVSQNDGELVIGTANAFGRDWLQERLTGTVERVAKDVIGRPAGVRFVVLEAAVR